MTANFYDVIVLGTQLGPLIAGTLLAKRGFRVLLVAQDDLPTTYELGGITWPRAPFTFTAAGSPSARRIFAELALHQVFRRRATTHDPAFQVVQPNHRVDVALEDADLDREIEREFPEVRRPVEDFHRSIAHLTQDVDRIAGRDLVWPPETFFERREFARATVSRVAIRDPFAEFPDKHPFRLIAHAPARFSDGIDPDHMTPLRLMRLYGAWRKGAAVLEGGESALRQMLIEKLRTHSGELRERDRADALIQKRGVVTGVRIAGSGEELGCGFVVGGGDIAKLLRLLPDRTPFEELFEKTGEPQPRWYRYTLNVLVRAEGIPMGMARDVFFIRDPRQPLSAENIMHVQVDPADAHGRRLMCVEVLLPRRAVEDTMNYIDGVREKVFAALADLVPFLGRHVLAIDSPHDGRPMQDIEHAANIAPAEPWTRGMHTMQAIHAYPVPTTMGTCALPVRTPIKRLLICNTQVVPGLGMEGLMLAAWSVARIVTRADRKKAWMRGRLWTKVEI